MFTCKHLTLVSLLNLVLKLKFYLSFAPMHPPNTSLFSLLFLITVSICPAFAFGQADTVAVDSMTAIPFIANWSVGDSFRYSITEIDVKYIGDSTATNDTVRYEADFIVMDSTATGYVVVWDSDKKSEDPDEVAFYEQAGDELMARIDSLGDVRPRFKTNEFGQFLGITETERIAGVLKVVAPSMIEFILEQDTTPFLRYMDSTQRETFTRFLLKKMDDELAPNKLTKEFLTAVPYLLYPLGAQYPLRDTTEASIEINATIPGETVLQHIRYYFDGHQPENGYIHFKVFAEVDTADGIMIMAESLRQKGFSEDRIQDFVQNGYYQEREDNDFYYYYGYGLAEGVDCFKEVTVEAPGEQPVVTIRHLIIDILREE